MKVDDFNKEMREAVKAYELYVVCIAKTPDEFMESVRSLMAKAIKVFESRAPGLKHGIALDPQLTIILSEPPEAVSEGRPLCAIYFNLHSPYRKKTAPAKSKA
ncbi:MAG: hypothetical protein NTY01_16325 [Verrucomicrobia bacterium]|nr:hypothetical protein [Verrucomicrobiota bacterium]